MVIDPLIDSGDSKYALLAPPWMGGARAYIFTSIVNYFFLNLSQNKVKCNLN